MLVLYNFKVIDESTLRDNLGAAVSPQWSADQKDPGYFSCVKAVVLGSGGGGVCVVFEEAQLVSYPPGKAILNMYLARVQMMMETSACGCVCRRPAAFGAGGGFRKITSLM